MKRFILASVFLLTLSGVAARAQTKSVTPSVPAATPAPPAWLDRRVRDEVAKFEGTVSLYAKNLDTGAQYSFGGEERVRTASTVKVAVMIEAFARVAEGHAKWTDDTHAHRMNAAQSKKRGGA